MKKFSDWWKEKYQCPFWGFKDEPQQWVFQRLVEAMAEYFEENMSNKFKCNWDDFKKVLETTDIIPIRDSRVVGSDYTSEPVIQPMGRPKK